MSNFSDFFPVAGTSWVTAIQTGNFTAVAGEGYFVNTSSAVITVTLPAGVVGTQIVIQDYAGTFATNAVTLTANSIVTKNATATLIYQDATKGWTGQDVSLVLPTLNVFHLIVGGGGAGGKGSGGGGGGAGGYKTNYGGTATLLVKDTDYSIDVGVTAPGVSISTAPNQNGDASTWNGISAIGGGGGANESYNSRLGGSGDSGGGGGYDSSGGAGQGPGYNGGNGSNTSAGQGFSGGGGGGFASDGLAAGAGGTAGNGGSGIRNDITVATAGTGPFYAAGGGGGSQTSAGGAGTAGIGGSSIGGNGLQYLATPTSAMNGVDNTGSGGGGSNSTPSEASGTGASGVVILRYPKQYQLNNSAADLTFSTTAVGTTDKVTIFTQGTGVIQFN